MEVALRAELSVLREENRQLRALLKPQCYTPREWRLTAREETVCLALLGRETASRDYLYACLYDVWHEGPEPKIIDVFICKLRRKVAPYHFHIETVHARGYMVRDRHIWRRRLGLALVGVSVESPSRDGKQEKVGA